MSKELIEYTSFGARMPLRTLFPANLQLWVRSDSLRVACAVSLILFATLRMGHAFFVLGEAEPFADTEAFLTVARHPVLSASFWIGPRPPLVPMVYRLCGLDPLAVTLFQTGAACLGWGALALSVTLVLGNRLLRLVAFYGILLLALSRPVILWDSVMLSESLALSASVFLLALCIFFGRLRLLSVAVALAAALVVWSMARETHVALLPLLAVLFVVAARRGVAPRASLGLAGLSVVLFVAHSSLSYRAERWKFPLLNIIGERVLVYDELRDHFLERGMPPSTRLLTMAGKQASGDNWAFYKDPELEQFRQWLDREGNAAYLSLLITHPRYTVLEMLKLLPLAANPVYRRTSPRFSSLLPAALRKLGWPFIPVSWFVWIGAATAFLIFLFAREQLHPSWWVVSGLMLSLPLQLFTVVHGDSMELFRHSLLFAVTVRIVFFLTALVLIEWVSQRIVR